MITDILTMVGLFGIIGIALYKIHSIFFSEKLSLDKASEDNKRNLSMSLLTMGLALVCLLFVMASTFISLKNVERINVSGSSGVTTITETKDVYGLSVVLEITNFFFYLNLMITLVQLLLNLPGAVLPRMPNRR